MHFLKSLFSHLFAIIIFLIILFISGTNIIRGVLTHNTLVKAISETNYMEKVVDESTSEFSDFEEVWEYIEIDDIINDYVADKFLYELKIINNEPKIDLDELNERIASGIEAYIDDKINEYTGGVNSLLQDAGIDLGIEEKVYDYINNNIGIDLSNNEIITENDLESIYKKVDDAFIELRESTYLYEILEIVYNNTLQIILIITAFISFIIIALINFNVVTALSYIIAPFIVNAVIFLASCIISNYVDVSGGIEANAINYLINEIGTISFKYFIILTLIAIIIIFLYYIGKRLSITISHKTGKTTLDTFFDDYNRDEVIKEIEEKENAETEEKE